MCKPTVIYHKGSGLDRYGLGESIGLVAKMSSKLHETKPTPGQVYKTAELEVASFLRAQGHRLLSSKLEGKVVIFEFGENAAADVELYFSGIEVSARDLFEAHRSLRALIQQVREHATQKIGSEKKHHESNYRR